ncbi:MAG: lycopene cyclase domain-containing protein [Candidatus Omnitrophota bacterium]
MKEYTILSVASVLAAVLFDRMSGTRLLCRKEFCVFLFIILCFKLLVNGYLTRQVVLYNPQFFLGYRIFTIPFEDFLFGFSMVTVSIVLWERGKRRQS